MRGTVMDQNKARVPGASVDLLNKDTGVHTLLKSNGEGVFDSPSLVPGTYSVTVSREGFKTFTEEGILLIPGMITVNATLQVGAASQTVTVQASSYAELQVDSAEVRLDIDEVLAKELPNVGGGENSYLQVIPGVMPSGNTDMGGQIQGVGRRSGDLTAVDGEMGGFMQSTLNGGTRSNPSGGGMGGWSVVPVDSVDTFNFVLANFGAQYGNGLSQFNVTTKSGTNQWHGTAYEFVQNDFFNARNYFNYNPPWVAPFKWNNFGGTLGGPVKKNKMFFFFSFQRNPTKSFDQGYYSFPVASMRNGDFSQVPALDGSGQPTGLALPVYDPNSLTQDPTTGVYTRTQLPGNKMNSGQISSISAAIVALLPEPNFLNKNQPGQSPQACAATEGLLPQGCFINNYYSFGNAHPLNWTTYLGKVDYDITSSNRLSSSLMVTKNFEDASAYPVAPVSGNSTQGGAYVGQLSDYWTISSSMVNEARVSLNRMDMGIISPDENKGYAQKLGGGIPGDLSTMFPGFWANGGQTFSMGTNGTLAAKWVTTTGVGSDILTWTKGRHVIKAGGEWDLWNDNEYWNSNSTFGFSGLATQNPSAFDGNLPYTQGFGYADFLFGDVQSWGDGWGDTLGKRDHSVQLFVNDDYKIGKNLTIIAGLRWLYQPSWHEAKNRYTNFSPTTVNPGDPADGALGAAVYGNSTAPDTQWALFAPRFGFAYSPASKWVLRGGWGIYYTQKLEGSAGGSFGDPTSSVSNVNAGSYSTDNVHPAFNWNNGVPGYFQATAADLTPDHFNWGGIIYAPKRQPLYYMEEWQVSVQHDLWRGFLLDVGYVANRGLHLPFFRDFNQVPQSQLWHYDPTTGTDMNQYRPYPQYTNITMLAADGISMYNSLQATVKKRFSQGLTLTAAFTQSKNHDSHSSYGGSDLNDPYQNAHDIHAAYALSVMDVPYMLNGGAVYDLPLGKGKLFLNHGGLVDAIAGGWQLSGIWVLHAGIDFSPTTTNVSGSLAGSEFPNRVGDPMKAGPVSGNPGCQAPDKIHTLANWYNPCAFVTPAIGHWGGNERNSLRGPAWRSVDMSVGKSFAIPVLGEATKFQIRMDATDAFNHPNFGVPDSYIPDSTAGLITSAQSSRSVQLGARLQF